MNKRERIIKAMQTLLNKYPIEKITVDMIVEQTDLSRTSFYHYFQDKYQLMTACYLDYADYAYKLSEEELWEKGQETALEKIFQFMQDNKNVFENMFKSEGQDSFAKFLYTDNLFKLRERYMQDKGVTSLTLYESYLMEFYVSGVIHGIGQWVKNGMDLSPKELTDIILERMPAIIKDALIEPVV